MKGYKFYNSLFHDAIFESGSVRIGTAESYRLEDGTVGGFSDTEELTSNWVAPDGEYRRGDREELEFFFNANPALETVQLGGAINFRQQHDLYLFCASSKITKLMIRRMYKDFGYDSCYEISDLVKFSHLLMLASEKLQSSDVPSFAAGHWAINPVQYGRAPTLGKGRTGGVFHKRVHYRWQNELRVLWPGTAPREPFTLIAPAVIPLIKPVDLKSGNSRRIFGSRPKYRSP